MKVLVAVASKRGSTREIAGAIAEEIRTAGLDVDLREASDVDEIDSYEAVVLGSAIYMGSWMPEAKWFAEVHRTRLSMIPVWLFSSGPLGEEAPQPMPDIFKLAEPMGEVAVRDHHIFVGKLDPSTLGLAEKLMTKVVGAPYGDFRDWDDIRVWARVIAAELNALVPTA
jgi:menaquinone-dependent protoporphyrinogen oxidase